MPPKVRSDGEHVIHANTLRALVADVVRLGMGLINPLHAQLALGDEVDWVYERLSSFQSLGTPFKRRGIPWILETNSLMFQESKTERRTIVLDSVARDKEISAYRRSDVIVCVSDSLKSHVVDSANIDPDKIIVMPNAVDLNRFLPLSPLEPRNPEGITIGYVGYLVKWQALDLLLRAVAELKSEGMILRVVILGKGPARAEWEELSASLGLENQVDFKGHVAWKDVPKNISLFDVGYSGQAVLKSGDMYLSPLKLYEYMAAGKPVIASAFADARSLISGKDTGFLFDPSDLDDLVRTLKEVYAARSRLADMGRKAHDEIAANHTWTARVRDLIPKVEKVLAGQARS